MADGSAGGGGGANQRRGRSSAADPGPCWSLGSSTALMCEGDSLAFWLRRAGRGETVGEFRAGICLGHSLISILRFEQGRRADIEPFRKFRFRIDCRLVSDLTGDGGVELRGITEASYGCLARPSFVL